MRLPPTAPQHRWVLVSDTDASLENHGNFYLPGTEPAIDDQHTYPVRGRSLVILIEQP